MGIVLYTVYMNSKVLLPLTIVGLLGAAGFYLLMQKISPSGMTLSDAKNTSYIIEGVPVALTNGKAETQAFPGSPSSRITTTVFGDPTVGDLNGDGSADAAVILVQKTGGSGVFYYVAAALQTTDGMKGTNAILLGDRIAPQTLELNGEEVIANYADRNPGEPMTTNPSVGVSKYLKVEGMRLVEVGSPIEDAGGSSVGGETMTSPDSLTQQYNDMTVFYDVGDRFTLSLGEGEWNLQISDPSIVSRVTNISTLKGSQGVYTATKAGKTKLTADGTVVCTPPRMCPDHIVHFSVNITVLGKSTAVPAGTAGNSGICTADAKMCPDGSYVGRAGPSCEFAACPSPKGSGIQGNVVVGPTCGVESTPPDPSCAPKPYAAALGIFAVGGIKAIKNVTASQSGIFSVALPPGTYEIRNDPQAEVLPDCRSNEPVVVKTNAYTTVTISCDNGIR